MSYSTCMTCGGRYDWQWEEAFNKFGFGDGGRIVMTETIADALRAAGYAVTVEPWGIHIIVITAIERNGQPIIPDGATIGYDNPRHYLPPEIVKLLDEAFPEHAEVQP